MEAIKYIVDLGPTVMLPIIIFIIGLFLRQGIGKSLRSGLTVGIGFVGINLVISLMTDNLGDAAKAMAENYHLGLNVIDIGWPGTSPMAWASNVGLIAIPVAILINIVMLITKLTKVVNVDIWNIWHFAFTGAILQVATGSYFWAIAGIAIHAAISFKLGDMFTPVTDEYFGLEGIAMPHGSSSIMGVIAAPIDDLIEHTPGLRKVILTPDKIEEKMGVFGQPTIIGAILGCLIGVLAKYPIGKSLTLAVQMAGVMVLMPMVVKLIMEGLIPISDSARKLLEKHFSGADFRIGLDCALMLGDPAVVASSMIFVPLSLLIAVLLPGNQILPFGDLATIGFFVALAVGVHKGNIFRVLFSGTAIMAMTIWISNQMGTLQQTLGQQVGLTKVGEKISSLDQAGSPLTYILTKGISMKVGLGFFVILIIYVFCFGYTFLKYKKGTLYVEK